MKDIKFNYENKNNNSYLVYELERIEEIDRLEQNMMSSNKIEGLLDFIYSNIDDKHCFKYDITSKITLKMYLDRCHDEEKIIKIFINIFKLLIEIEDFMLLKEHLFLHDDYVFIDVSSLQVYFICLPIEDISIENGVESISLKQFINKILNKLRIESFENKPLISLLKEFLSKEEFLNIEEIKNVLKNMLQDKKNKAISSTPKPAHPEEENELKKVELDNIDNFQERKIKKISRNNFDFLVPGQEKNLEMMIERKEVKKRIGIKDIFKFSSFSNKKKENSKVVVNRKDRKLDIEKSRIIDKNKYEININSRNHNDEDNITSKNGKTNNNAQEISYNKTVMIKNSDDNEKTVLLNALNSGLYPSMPYLIRKKNNEKINITSNLFRIGKETDYVDYVILDNSTISRAHADIVKINNEYFMQDNNSKNHSYVNEIMVSDGHTVKLEHNSEIKLSNEVFIFKLH